MKKNLPLLALITLLSACASTQSHYPRDLRGEFDGLTARDAALADYSNHPVRWGGRIIQIEPKEDRTCFEMVAARLDAQGRPDWHDESDSRFIACRNGFFDPTVFRINRDVTFTGTIGGYENRRIGQNDYRFPRLEADTVHLWPERQPPARKKRSDYFWWLD